MEELVKIGAAILGAAIIGGAVYAGLEAFESGEIDLSDVAEDVADGAMDFISSATDFGTEVISSVAESGSLF